MQIGVTANKMWYDIMYRYGSKTQYPQALRNGCCMAWSYFGSGHGKGVHDGAGAVLKQEIREEQSNIDSPYRLQNAADVVAFCLQKQGEEHAAYSNVRRDVTRFFHLVKVEDVDCESTWDCKQIPGCCSMHSVSSVSHHDITFLKVQDLVCFYVEAMDDNSEFWETRRMCSL